MLAIHLSDALEQNHQGLALFELALIMKMQLLMPIVLNF